MDLGPDLRETTGASPAQMSTIDNGTVSSSNREARSGRAASVAHARRVLAEHLDLHRHTIEKELRNRVESVADTSNVTDPEYIAGLRASIGAGLDYALSPLTCSERHLPDVPAVILTQARVAARNGVRLDAILLRCSAYRTIIKKVSIEVAVTLKLVGLIDLPELIRAEGALFERLMEEIAETYASEKSCATSHDMRRLSLVRSLLAGESVDASELGYELVGVFHTAAIVRGTDSSSVVEGLASVLDCVVLTVKNGDGATWVWLGRREPPAVEQVEELIAGVWPSSVNFALGEANHGLDGWRRSHRQAAAAFPVALHKPGTPVRYADDPVLFSAAHDPLLAESLHNLYLAPLISGSDGGTVFLQTLRAYFAADRNGASAAAALQISRQTVNNRLKSIDNCLGRPLASCANGVEAALRLADLNDKVPFPGVDMVNNARAAANTCL